MKNETTVRTEIHYAQVGDYQLPLLTLPQTDNHEPLGKYARMRLTYLKTQRPTLYNRMLLNGSLWPHLQKVQRAASEQAERTIAALADKFPCARQRTLTAPLGGPYEHAESAGRGSGGEGDRVRRVISTVPHVSVSASKTSKFDFVF